YGTQNTLTVNIDNTLKAFGLGFEIGTVNVAVNPKTHDVFATVTKAEEWITLTAQTVENAENFTFNINDYKDYLNLNFVSDLVEDVNTTLDNMTYKETVDGKEVEKTDLKLSYKGTIKINIDVSSMDGIVGVLGNVVNIEFKNAVVTVGLDSENDFYFTLYGQVQPAKAKDIIDVISTASYVSLTYSKGYITLGREVDKKNTAIYKVMTLDYLLDNLLVKGDEAPLRWWLNISNSGLIKVWVIFAGNVNVPISSNLTKIDDYFVFDNKVEEEEPTDKNFVLSDIIKAISVNGNKLHGDIKSMSDTFNAYERTNSDNYYGFDINGEALLGNTLPTLYVGLLHNDTDGISGLLAHAIVAGMITADVNLDAVSAKHADNY
ncbi:MAG: hypothetical protein K2K24_03770, partial [Clostridia bacterium]|nr:hypothetical protein [Clostridia bacterium]